MEEGDKDMEEKELPFLVEGLLSGDNRSLTRLISLVEDDVNRQGKWDTIGTKVNGHLRLAPALWKK